MDVGLVSLCGFTSFSSKNPLNLQKHHTVYLQNEMLWGFVGFLHKLLDQEFKLMEKAIALCRFGIFLVMSKCVFSLKPDLGMWGFIPFSVKLHDACYFI